MSRLQTLLDELCPDGVKFIELRELFHTRNGYTPSKSKPEFWENGNIPWFRMEDIRENGRILLDSFQHVTPQAIKGSLFPAGSIIVATSATIGEHALILVDSLANQRFTYLTLKKEYADCFDIKFLFYYCFKLDEYCLVNLNQGNFASVDMDKFAQFKFPLVPLPVQAEIVRILDTFTELTAELTDKLHAELIARRKQYEYYRDSLFSFNINRRTNILEWMTLDKIAENCDFQRKPVTRKHRIAGKYPYYGASGVVDYVNEYIFDGDYLLVSEDGANLLARSTPIAFSIFGKNWVNNHAHVLKFHEQVTRRYTEFYLNSIDLDKYISGGAQPKLNQQNLNKIPIPVPPLDEQRRIVAILDRFDALCNDLTSGLPAELAARRKQYEYYRDRLLSFQQLDA